MLSRETICKCRTQARVFGGPSLRKRSAALINEDLLVDLGPEVMAASQMHGCPLDIVRYCAPVLDFYAPRETTRGLQKRLSGTQ